MATTARQFAAELEQAGCRIEWDDFFTDSTFKASRGRGSNGRGVLVVFYSDGSAFWHAYRGDCRLRSMKAIREHLGVEKPSC